MVKKNLICIALLCMIQQALFSQITSLEHLKYWHYRQKLISDFLVVGVEDPITCTISSDGVNTFGGYGLSLPSGGRYDYSSYPNHYNWGDCTSYLGWYIGVLATELRLLYNNNPDYNNWRATQYELYCAIKAYERLDMTCAAIDWENYPTRCNPINGTFIRDDVDGNLFEHSKAFDAKKDTWDSDLKKAQNSGANAYPSQDQIAYLFMGFSLVKKCLEDFPPLTNVLTASTPRIYTPPNDSKTAPPDQVDLITLVQSYTSVIAYRMMNNSWRGSLDNGDNYQNYDGLNASGNAFAFAYAASHITGDNNFTDAFCGFLLCLQNWRIQQEFKKQDFYFGALSNILKENDYAASLTLCYAAVGNTAWDTDIFGSIKSIASSWHMDIYELLNQYLYYPPSHYIGDDLKNEFVYYIQTAPYQGPMYYPTNSAVGSGNIAGIPGWKASNRFIRSHDKEGGGGIGDFNGLDFMLLYNLFWLVNPDPTLLQTRYVNGHILDTNNDIKTSGSVYRDAPIHLASKIMPPQFGSSSVYMKSSFEINLLPGFETVNNTDILLEAKPMINPDGSDFRTISASDVCNGFDFQIGNDKLLNVVLTCNVTGATTINWTVNGTAYSGSAISFRPIPGQQYTIICTANIGGVLCSKTKGIIPMPF